MQSIHCKVSFDDEFRRFQFTYEENKNNLIPLQNRLRSLYVLDGDIILRYKDDESDLVTIGSEEELKYAISDSAGLLRLFIELKASPLAQTDPSITRPVRQRKNRPDAKFKIEKLTAKRTSLVASLTSTEVSTNERQKQKLQRKLESIDCRLAVLLSKSEQTATVTATSATATTPTPATATATITTVTTTATTASPITVTYTTTTQSDTPMKDVEVKEEVEESSSSDEETKYDKKQKRKKEKKNKNKPRKVKRNLTEDDKAMLVVLKGQIRELKPSLNAVKIQMREKKILKADAKANGDQKRVDELEKEIQQLKEIKLNQKKAIVPLKQQIFTLKFELQSNQ